MSRWRVASRMTDREKEALQIVHRLVDSGFRAVFAGGCVRDRILGIEPKDYDIATDARPEVVQKLFDRTVAVGAKFGVIGVVLNDDKPIEVATFRADAEYTDGRRPSSVRFGAIEEDAIRRDFTINGMFYDPIADRLIDLVGGMRDLRAGIIRAIGNPYDRFEEDHLRILRAARFAARMNFTIDPATWAAMKRAAPTIRRYRGRAYRRRNRDDDDRGRRRARDGPDDGQRPDANPLARGRPHARMRAA